MNRSKSLHGLNDLDTDSVLKRKSMFEEFEAAQSEQQQQPPRPHSRASSGIKTYTGSRSDGVGRTGTGRLTPVGGGPRVVPMSPVSQRRAIFESGRVA